MNRYLIGGVLMALTLWFTSGERMNQWKQQLAGLGQSRSSGQSTLSSRSVPPSMAEEAAATVATATPSSAAPGSMESMGNLVQRQSQSPTASSGVPSASTSVFNQTQPQTGAIPQQVPMGETPFTTTTPITSNSVTNSGVAGQLPPATGDISPINQTGITPTRPRVTNDQDAESIPALW